MAGFALSEVTAGFTITPPAVFVTTNIDWSVGINVWTAGLGTLRPAIYKMRGQDALVDALYDCWLSPGQPDPDARAYIGALAKPLRDVCVIDSWDTLPAAGTKEAFTMPSTLIVLRCYLTSTTPQRLTSTPTPVTSSAFIKAEPTNTAVVAVVVDASGSLITGMQLAPGDPTVVDIDDLSKLWFVTTSPPQAVAVLASR